MFLTYQLHTDLGAHTRLSMHFTKGCLFAGGNHQSLLCGHAELAASHGSPMCNFLLASLWSTFLKVWQAYVGYTGLFESNICVALWT